MKTRLSILVAVTVGVLLLAAPSASARTTVVRGAQILVDATSPCFDTNAAFSTVVEGGLIGCWWVDTFDITGATPSGVVTASGTERFSGCLDANLDGSCGVGDPTGTFGTSYTFTGKYDASGAEMHGRCHHPITGGTGGFEGATGVISWMIFALSLASTGVTSRGTFVVAISPPPFTAGPSGLGANNRPRPQVGQGALRFACVLRWPGSHQNCALGRSPWWSGRTSSRGHLRAIARRSGATTWATGKELSFGALREAPRAPERAGLRKEETVAAEVARSCRTRRTRGMMPRDSRPP